MRTPPVWNSLVGALAAILVGGLPHVDRTMYVTVVGSSNVPVRGLTVADFVVKEDGQDRPVQSVAPATAPLHIVVCGDWFGDLGEPQALESFVAAVAASQPTAEFAFGDRLQWTRDLGRVHAIITASAHDARNSSEALSCILAAGRGLAGTELSRPVVVTFFNEQLEERDATELGVNSITEVGIVDALQRGPTSLWALVRSANGALQPNSTNDALRRRVYTDTTSRTGGLRLDAGLDSKGATKALLALADLLDAQYAVTFTPGAAAGTGDLKVASTRKNVKMLAPHLETPGKG